MGTNRIIRVRMLKCLRLAYIKGGKKRVRTLLVFGSALIARHYILLAPDATQRLLSDFKSCVCAAVRVGRLRMSAEFHL